MSVCCSLRTYELFAFDDKRLGAADVKQTQKFRYNMVSGIQIE